MDECLARDIVVIHYKWYCSKDVNALPLGPNSQLGPYPCPYLYDWPNSMFFHWLSCYGIPLFPCLYWCCILLLANRNNACANAIESVPKIFTLASQDLFHFCTVGGERSPEGNWINFFRGRRYIITISASATKTKWQFGHAWRQMKAFSYKVPIDHNHWSDSSHLAWSGAFLIF